MAGRWVSLLLFPDPDELERKGDLPGLIRLLGSGNFDSQWQTADRLGRLGKRNVPLLVLALSSPSVSTRLGIIDALSVIRDERSVLPLIQILEKDPITEVRWAASLALGEIGSTAPIPVLVRMLRDKNRYIRYGSARSLARLGWRPVDDEDRAYERMAYQDWDAVITQGKDTVSLLPLLKSDDPGTRDAIISLLEKNRSLRDGEHMPFIVQDPDSRLRWRAVLASLNCGVSPCRIPLAMAGRKRTGPKPLAAAILNFLFLGLGYNYLGKWWGFPVFMVFMTGLVLAQMATGPFLPYLVAYPVTGLLAIQTYIVARRMNET